MNQLLKTFIVVAFLAVFARAIAQEAAWDLYQRKVAEAAMLIARDAVLKTSVAQKNYDPLATDKARIWIGITDQIATLKLVERIDPNPIPVPVIS